MEKEEIKELLIKGKLTKAKIKEMNLKEQMFLIEVFDEIGNRFKI